MDPVPAVVLVPLHHSQHLHAEVGIGAFSGVDSASRESQTA